MKKGNRVLALFLAIILTFTSVAWDFSDVSKAQAAETQNPSYLEYDFESMTDVSVLDSDFTAHVQGGTEADSSVADNWFSGKTATGAESSEVNGLKVKQRTANGTSAVYRYLKHKNTYTNFHLKVEMYPDANTMVLVGHEPDDGSPDSGNSDAFMFWFSSQTGGAWRGGGKTQATKSGFVKNKPYTLHIRVEGGRMSAWFDEIDWSTSFTLGTAFESPSSICIRQRRNRDSATNGGKNGAFKSLAIRDLDVSYEEGYYDFDNIDVSKLTDNFTATQFNKDTKKIVGTANQAPISLWYSGKSYEENSRTWTSTNVGLKPKATTDNTYNHLLNYKHGLVHFKMSTEICFQSNTGVTIGAENAAPTTTNTDSIMLWLVSSNNQTRIAMGGTVDISSASTTAGGSMSGSQFVFKNTAPKDGEVYELNVELKERVLKIWVTGYESVCTVNVTDTHPRISTVALWNRAYTASNNPRGFKSFAIEKLNVNTGTTVDQDGYTSFDKVNMNVLDEKGFTATRFDSNNNYAIVGEDKPVSTYWAVESDVNSVNEGIKPNTKEADKKMTLLNTPYQYQNFKLSTEVYWGSNTGVVLGEKNVFPIENTASSIRIYFNANQIQIVGGGLDYDVKYLSGGGTWNAGYAPTYIFKPVSNFAKEQGKVYTLNIQLMDGMLTVWLEGYEGRLEVKVSDTFKNESIALLGRNYDGDGGGFKSLTVKQLEAKKTGTTVDVDGYTDFDNVKISVLEEKGFNTTQFDANNDYAIVGEDKPVSTYWETGSYFTSKNNGIKPNTKEADKKMTLLNTPYKYENFKLSTEVYWGSNTGIVLGEKNVFPIEDTASSIRIYFNANQIQIVGGGLNYDVKYVSGGASWNAGYAPTYIFKPTADFMKEAGKVYTLNVQLLDDVLTVWLEGYEGRLEVKVSDTFKNESIALVGRNYDGDGGGFKSLIVKELNSATKPQIQAAKPGEGFREAFLPTDTEFEITNLENDFSAYYFVNGAKESTSDKISFRWADTNWGLRPTHNRDKEAQALLTYDKLTFKNVEITTKYQRNWGQYAVMIAPKGELATVENHGIKAWVESEGKIRVTGAIDAGSATATGGYVTILGQNMIAGYNISDYAKKATEKFYNLHVKIEGDVLSIWMDEVPEYVISVKVTEEYQGGVVSLYSNGNNDGGFGTFTATEIEATQRDTSAYTQSFSAIDSLNDLEDFKAYTLDSIKNTPVEVEIDEAFRYEKGRVQSISPENGKNEKTNFSILTLTNKKYENFELTLHYEQSRMQRYGVMIGTELGEFAYSEVNSKLVANGGAFIYTEAESYRNIKGSMHTSSYTKASELLCRKNSKLDSFWWFNNDVMNNVQQKMLHTMTVRVEGDYMTVVIDNDENSKMTVCLKDYEGGYISLVANSAANEYGGFAYLSIKELPGTAEWTPVQPTVAQVGEGFSEEFTTSEFKVSDLNDKFDGYYFETDETEAVRLDPTVIWSKALSDKGAILGLKPYHTDKTGERTVLTYKERSFKNVDISARFQRNWVQYGVMIAPIAELATTENNSIKVWVESDGIIKIVGAIDAGSATSTGRYIRINGSSDSVVGFNIPDFSKKATNKFYNLHVKVDGNVLSVWMDEFPDYVIKVNVTDAYQGGVVSLYSTGNQSGGFGTFTATEIEATQKDTSVYTQSFSDISSLDELTDFTAYSLATVKDTAKQVDISEAFRLAKGRMQAISPKNGENDRTNWSILTLNNKTYKNFEMTVHYEQSRMQRYAVMFGTELGEFAYSEIGSRLSSNGGTLVFTEAEGYRNVKGKMYASFYTKGMELLHRDRGDEKLNSFWWYNNDVMNNVQRKTLHTMTIRVVGEYMTMIIDNDESSRVTVRLADYNGGYVSLVSDAAANEFGAFTYMSIKELAEDSDLETAKPGISDGYEIVEDVDKDFDAYYLKDAKESNKMEKVDIKEHWWVNKGGFVSRATNASGYTVEEDVEVLTYTKQTFTDFEMTYTYHQNWLRFGVLIGEDMGEYPLSYVDGKLTADKGAVVFLEAEGYTNVQGHLYNMTKKDNLLYRTTKTIPEGFKDGNGKADGHIGKEHVVKIVVKDRALYVFIDGNTEPAAYVNLGENYKGGYISMFAHTGNAYGFSNFSITDKVTTTLPKGGGTSVSGNTFTADFSTAKFDDSAFATYYLAHTKGNAEGIMEQQNFADQWTINNGVLIANNRITAPTSKTLTEFEYDDSTKVAVLTYNKKLTDFVVSYDFQKTPQRMMFMFGTEMGKFALAAPNTTQKGQGVLLYPENDLGAGGGLVALGNLATYNSNMRPSNRTKVILDDYHTKGEWASNVGAWHTMTVAVINGHCYVYLDDYGMIADYELIDYEGGYISLATTGRSGGFDNLKITDLEALSENDIIAAENPNDITVLVGTELSAIGLPRSVKATTKTGQTVDVPATWKSLNYNASEVGVYQFTALLDETTHVGARIQIRVVEEMPKTQAGVKYWTFDTEDDLKDFKAYYLKNVDSGYLTEGVPNWYVSSSGKLTRDAFRAVNGDQYKELAILTYAGEKYTNFEMEVEYTQQWQRMMVMFGSEKVGQYIDLKDIYAEKNPVAGFVEMEGVRNFIGNLVNANFDSNDKEKINNARESGIRLENYYDEVLSGGNQGKKHTMKIRVVGDQAMMWVDDAKDPYVCTLTNYDGGYISLVTCAKSGSYDNLKITRLNAKGEPVAEDPNAVANGEECISIDETAATDLVLPKREKPEGYKEILGEEKGFVIPTIAYIVGGTTIALAAVVGGLFIMTALKKKKKENL